MSSEALLNVTHCSGCGQKGPAGALTFACDAKPAACATLMCDACALHHAGIHSIQPLQAVIAGREATLRGAMEGLASHCTRVAQETAQARRDLAGLPAKRAAAAAALEHSFQRHQARLRALYDAQIADLDAAYTVKSTALTGRVVKSRAVLGEAATLRLACERALASSDPLTRVQVGRSAADTLRKVEAFAASCPTLDPSLGVAAREPEGGSASLGALRLGRLITTWEAKEQCSLVWDTREACVTPMTRVPVTLVLRAHDGSPADVPVKVVTIMSRVYRGLHAGSRPGAGGGSADADQTTGMQATLVGPGVFQATYTVPYGTEDGTEFTAVAMVQGRLVAEASALRVFACPPLTWVTVKEQFDPLRLQTRKALLVSNTEGGVPLGVALPTPGFLGRTTLISPHPHEALQFQLEVTTGSGSGAEGERGRGTATGKVIVALGSQQTIGHASMSHDSNAGLAFFYDAFRGLVNVTPSRVTHTGQDRARAMPMDLAGTTYVLRFRVCQRTLTFKAGRRRGQGQQPELDSQPGQWVVPTAFYLLVACRHNYDEYSFRVSYV